VLKIALVQTTTGIDVAANARRIAGAVSEAARAGACMVFTPEMSGLLDRNTERLFAGARLEAEDAVLAAAREAAAQSGIWVALGSLALRDPKHENRLVNRSFLIDAAGEIRARYYKIQLFDVEAAPGETYRESASFAPGESAVVADTPWGRLGLSVCYDVRFPRLYDALSGAGAAMIAVPAAFTRPTGKAHWHTLLRARAIETEAFVIAAAQSGVHEDGRATFGHSLVVSPWGEILLDMGEAPGVAFCELDLAQVADVRRRIPVLSHRREIGVPA
jgi:predicted amidohydrolase